MATLSLVESVDAFLSAIEKSGLLSADALTKVREAAAKADSPKGLARPLVKDGTLTNWQASQLLYGFHKLVIGKYKLLNQLGAGEMGRVYLAEHVQMGRKHCLKVLSRRHTAKPDVLKRFLDEAQKVCALEHRNLSHVYDVNQGGDQYYLVMEYVEGDNLQALVEKAGKLPVAESLAYIRQAAEGLAHAHEHGVVHGDLKPSNLVLDEHGTVKILDIGQARLAEGPQAPIGQDDTAETTSLAAAIHHAPEQRGQVRSIDQRSDIYSLGSVLCFLLTGKAAPDSSTAQSQLQKIAKLPESLVNLCLQMMAEQPDDRLPDMQAVLTGLAAAERDRSVPPMPAAKPAEVKPSAVNGKGAKATVKAKKPPVAKALTESASLPVAKAIAEPAEATEADPVPEEEPSPFSGLAIQTKAPATKKPPVKSTSGEVPAVVNAAGGTTTIPTPAKRSYLPLIIGGSIGGGVLAITGVCLLAYFLFFRGGEPTEVAQAPKEGTKTKSTATTEAGPTESVPEGSNPDESNPAAESNPMPEANPVATAAPTPKPAEPNPGGSTTGSSTPPPMPEPEKPAEPPTPAPMPEPPKPAPTPAPAGNPLGGLAKAVSLPKLGSPTSDLPPETLEPKVLGPCNVGENTLIVARLKGGEFAARTGKQKFELAPANAGTALQDWEVSLVGPEGPVTIAKLSGKGGSLTFQWTPEGTKEANAPYLANCALELGVGADHQVIALREPVVGPPMSVEFEKQGTAKWLVDNLPDPKSIHFEITKVDGFPRNKMDPDNVMQGVGEDMTIWTGPTDDSMALGLNLKSSISGKNLQLATAPQLKFEGDRRAVPFSKKAINNKKTQVLQILNGLTFQLSQLGNGRENDAQKATLNQELEKWNQALAQIEALPDFIDAIQGSGAIQLRVYYVADESTQVELLVTSPDAAPPDKSGK